MNERFFYLLEKYLNKELQDNESYEFRKMIDENPELKRETEEQKNIKEVLTRMELKNPPREFWDKYWLGTYNKAERKFAWLLVITGAVILIAFAATEAVDQFFRDASTPFIIKAGTAVLTAGIVILLISVIREKFSTYKKDRYKEVQR